MLIRYAQENDIGRLLTLFCEHAAYEKASFVEEDKATHLHAALFTKQPKLNCLVVDINGQLIGYSTYMLQYSTWDVAEYIYMDCLFIKEGFRGQGLGEKLVNRIIEETRNLGCNLIQWQTPSFNSGAIKFYKKIGANSKEKQRFFLAV